jgi:hypothetical protein
MEIDRASQAAVKAAQAFVEKEACVVMIIRTRRIGRSSVQPRISETANRASGSSEPTAKPLQGAVPVA